MLSGTAAAALPAGARAVLSAALVLAATKSEATGLCLQEGNQEKTEEDGEADPGRAGAVSVPN